MELSSRSDFNLIAIPSQAQALRLANLAAADGGALNNVFTNRLADDKKRAEQRNDEMTAALMELTLAVHRETQARILRSFAIDDIASRMALEEIERELTRNARERQQMIDSAAKLDDGTAVFLDRDGRAIYTERGERLSHERTHGLLTRRRSEIEAGARWEDFEAKRRERMALDDERRDIHRGHEEREELRKRMNSGALTLEEMEELERKQDLRTPARVRRFRAEAEAEHNQTHSGNHPSASASSHSPVTPSARFNDVAAATDLDLPHIEAELPSEQSAPQRSVVMPILGR